MLALTLQGPTDEFEASNSFMKYTYCDDKNKTPISRSPTISGCVFFSRVFAFNN